MYFLQVDMIFVFMCLLSCILTYQNLLNYFCCCFGRLCLTLCNLIYCSTPAPLSPLSPHPHLNWCSLAIESTFKPSPSSSLPSPLLSSFQHEGLSIELALHIRASAFGVSASVLPTNVQDWFPPLDWLVGFSPRDLPVSSPIIIVWKHPFFHA